MKKTFTMCSCGKAIYDNSMMDIVNKCVVCNSIIKTVGKVTELDSDKKIWRYDLTHRKILQYIKNQEKIKKQQLKEEIYERRLEKRKLKEQQNELNKLIQKIKIVEVNDEYHYDIPKQFNIDDVAPNNYIIIAENSQNQSAYILKKICADHVQCYSENLGLHTYPKKSARKYISSIDSLNSHIKHAKLLLEKFGFFAKVLMYHKKRKK